jgi:uncharacterized BrkB/YihY/UPF0761 family membrane protein
VTWRPRGQQAEHSWSDDIGAIRANLILEAVIVVFIVVLVVFGRHGSQIAGRQSVACWVNCVFGPAYTFYGATVLVVTLFLCVIAIAYGWFLAATLPGRKRYLAWGSVGVAVGLLAGAIALAILL